MSWGYRLVGDALADLKELDVWLQEEVLDELDRLCAAPPQPRRPGEEIVADFERGSREQRHVVFIRARHDDNATTITILSIAAVTTPLSR